MLHELISHMNFFHLQWEPHNLRHVIFSKTRWEQAFFFIVCTSGTCSLIPQGSFWKRQTGVLLMVQGTVSENTSWIMERTVHVLQKATVREGCLISVSVPFKKKKKKIARSSVQFKLQGWSVSRLCSWDFLMLQSLICVTILASIGTNPNVKRKHFTAKKGPSCSLNSQYSDAVASQLTWNPHDWSPSDLKIDFLINI